MLFCRLALYEFCNSAVLRCEVSHQQHELPTLVAWQVLEGMRIDIQVIELGLQGDYDKLRRLQPQGQSVWNRFIRSSLNLQGHVPLVIQQDTTEDEHMLLQTSVSGVVRPGVVIPNAGSWNLRQPQNQECGEIEDMALMQLAGPHQSYGGSLRENERDDEAPPSKLSSRTMIVSAQVMSPLCMDRFAIWTMIGYRPGAMSEDV